MELKKIKNTSVVRQVIECITGAILKKELRPGDRIPPEQELVEELGVARNSIREAIKILEYIGVLEIRRPEGTFVRNGFSDSLIDPMVYGIILNQSDSFEQLMELRKMIETGVIRLAISKKTPESLKHLEECLINLQQEARRPDYDIARTFAADNQFHKAIMDIANNEMVEKINNVVLTLTNSVRYETTKGMIEDGRADEFLSAHEKMYQILASSITDELTEIVANTYFLDN